MKLVGSAEKSIILIDNYVDIATLNILAKKKVNVSVCIYTKKGTKLVSIDISLHKFYSAINSYGVFPANLCDLKINVIYCNKHSLLVVLLYRRRISYNEEKWGDEMTDNQIIELYFKRSEYAIKETNRKYGKYCHSIAYKILDNHEDSEECVNDTWYLTWSNIPPTRPEYLKLYLARIVRNLSFNKYKAKNRKKRGAGEIHLVLEELEECVAGQYDVENEYIAEELSKSIGRFVSLLPEREANVFIRRYFYVEPVSVIAGRYKISANNVGVILARSRKKLKKTLEKEGYII